MANFYKDNYDIQFWFRNMDIATLARFQEQGFTYSKDFDTAPATAAEAIENYEMVLDSLGQLSGDFIAPRAEGVDRQGNELMEDGKVKYADGIKESLKMLAQADVMGCTLPHRFGGINFPCTVYTMGNEVVSRADASLMNIFGLQGIAETIEAFASEEIKQEYLHDFSTGKVTGAMVLTEPDAGSDLQSVKLKAFQDEDGNWYLSGVKRFITNGCGDVLLVLARSEPDRAGGLGLSLFVCIPGPTVRVRRLEDKLGIHGSPTCEIFFDNTPCKLVGERQRGLVTYVMSLMNGARIGIAAQSLGIGEAAYRIARDYAASRKQFGVAIERLPAVRDLVIEMKILIEACRAMLYETCRVVDTDRYYERMLETNPPADKETLKAMKTESRKYSRLAAMLTPMSKYICSEMANSVAYDSIQVLGGSGYMRDYASERHARDARITTIYEGTSQLQVVAAVRGVCSGTAEKYLEELAAMEYEPHLKDLHAILAQSTETMKKCIVSVKQRGVEYMDLWGRPLVDTAMDLINGYLFLWQASAKVDMMVPATEVEGGDMVSMKKRKAAIARRFITMNAAKIDGRAALICSGDTSTMSEYGMVVGPVPTE